MTVKSSRKVRMNCVQNKGFFLLDRMRALVRAEPQILPLRSKRSSTLPVHCFLIVRWQPEEQLLGQPGILSWPSCSFFAPLLNNQEPGEKTDEGADGRRRRQLSPPDLTSDLCTVHFASCKHERGNGGVHHAPGWRVALASWLSHRHSRRRRRRRNRRMD